MTRTSGYFISIGSNIEPQDNIVRIVSELLTLFPRVLISPVIQTKPQGMESTRDFLNAVLFVETAMDAEILKTAFNDIEKRLGRNRADPKRKLKDRTADLDILFHQPASAERISADDLPSEAYIRPLVIILASAMGLEPVRPLPALTDVQTLSFGQESFGQAPAAIYRNGDAGHVMVLQQTAHREKNGMGPPFYL